jgi:hypothetical protein
LSFFLFVNGGTTSAPSSASSAPCDHRSTIRGHWRSCIKKIWCASKVGQRGKVFMRGFARTGALRFISDLAHLGVWNRVEGCR